MALTNFFYRSPNGAENLPALTSQDLCFYIKKKTH